MDHLVFPSTELDTVLLSYIVPSTHSAHGRACCDSPRKQESLCTNPIAYYCWLISLFIRYESLKIVIGPDAAGHSITQTAHTHTSSMGTQDQTKSITWHRILFFTSHTQPTRCTAISFDDKQQRIVLVRPYLSPFELLTFKGVLCVKKKLCIGSVDLLAGVAWWD